MIDFIEINARQSVDEAVDRLVTVSHFAAGSIVSMPVSYPSGSTVALEITMQQGRCFVSDRGGGFDEAEMLGATRHFASEATRIADSAGIRFDGHTMFVVEVPPGNLRGAMVVVANASAEAASATALRMAERGDHDAREQLYERLVSIYPTKDVQKNVELIGESNHKWRVSVLVLDKIQRWMFEPVTGNYISAVGTVAKFHDFARGEYAPSRAAVIKSRADMKDFYGLVAGASTKVLTMSDPDNEFAKLMPAA